MNLKRFTRISEWEVEINQGIPGIRNLGLPGKLENAKAGNYVMLSIGCGDMFTVSDHIVLTSTYLVFVVDICTLDPFLQIQSLEVPVPFETADLGKVQ